MRISNIDIKNLLHHEKIKYYLITKVNFPSFSPSLNELKLTFFCKAITLYSPFFNKELKETQKLKVNPSYNKF